VYVAVYVLLLQDPLRREFFLSPSEETTIRRYYEDQLLKFCREFDPPMPVYVMVRTKIFCLMKCDDNGLLLVLFSSLFNCPPVQN